MAPSRGAVVSDGASSSPAELEDEALRRALGKAIGIRRLELGLKRNDLRDRSGLSYPYIAELENGTKRGSTRALVALAGALELSLSELLERAELLREQEGLADESGEALSRPRAAFVEVGPPGDEPGSGPGSGRWFSQPLRSEALHARAAMQPPPSPAERPSARTRYPSRSRPARVEIDVDELLLLIRQVVREEVRIAVREALRYGGKY